MRNFLLLDEIAVATDIAATVKPATNLVQTYFKYIRAMIALDADFAHGFSS
jgi:hypothetical protein